MLKLMMVVVMGVMIEMIVTVGWDSGTHHGNGGIDDGRLLSS